ncbi:MAG: YfhO family protein, partial [Acetatifactor sp.]|nr:YfhO family protein [Acetatifactor sp.]
MSDVIITEENKSAVEADVVEVIAETAEKDAMSDTEEAVVVKNEATVEKELPAKKNLRKEILVFVLSFFVPVGMFVAIWASQGITWNGEVTPLIYDMQAQYMPFLASLRYVLSGDASLFYNWTLGMGGSYLSMFAYYIACPLNLITVFFPIEEMPNAIYLLTLIKIGLCGLTFNTFLRFGINKKESRYANVVFACCYALMSYNIVYSLCIMWLDGIIMLPLILLGIEQILDGKRGLLYCLSIGTLFFSNFYISYMVGIFAFLYLIHAMVIRYTKADMRLAIRSFWRFCVGTLIGGLLSAILLVPALTSYYSVSHVLSTGGVQYASDLSFIDVFTKFLPQQYDSLDYGGKPLIYCGTVMLFFCLAYFLQHRSIKEKISTIILMAILMLGFWVTFVDVVWHGFRFPHCFLFRYSFVVPVIILLTAYRAYLDMKIENSQFRIVAYIGLIYVMVELVLNGSVLTAGMNEEKEYALSSTFENPTHIFGTLAEKIREDKEFHRMGEGNINVTWDNQVLYNMVGVDSSSSTINDEVTIFLRNMGAIYSPSFSTLSVGLSYTMDSLLNIAYRIDTIKLRDEYDMLETCESGSYVGGLYYHPQTLSTGLVIPRKSVFGEDDCVDDVLTNQNTFAKQMTGWEKNLYPIVEPLIPVGTIKMNEISFEFETDGKNELILFLEASNKQT